MATLALWATLTLTGPDPASEPEVDATPVVEDGSGDSLEWDGSTDDLGLDLSAYEDPDSEGDASEAERESDGSPITGSARIFGGYLHYSDLPPPLPQEDDGLFATVFRAMARPELGEHARAEMNVFLELGRSPGTTLAGMFASAGATASAYRYPHLVHAFWSDGQVSGRLGGDRLALHLDAGPVFVSVGRFPVNLTVANLFTVNDFFAPFSATAINRVYKPGVDAVRVGVGIGALSSAEVIGALGYDASGGASWKNTAVLARAATVLGGFEWALLGGKVAQRWVAGGSAQGDVGPIGLRAEAHLGMPDRNGDAQIDDREKLHARVSAGPNVNFAWRNTVISAEYAYFSEGASKPSGYLARASRYFPDDLPYLAQHYVAVTAGLELIPILRLDTIALVNATDGSGLAGPFLSLSVADEVDLAVGAYAPWGKRPRLQPGALFPELRSELGLAPVTAFVQTMMYF